MSKYEFAQLHLRKNDWLFRQHVMRARYADVYARNARRILDIASGSGYCAYHLAQINPRAQVIGVDISAYAIEYASIAYQAPNLKFEQGNAFNLDYPDGFFDLVVTYETLEHVIDGHGFIRELARLTDSNGVMLCSTPNCEYDFLNKEHIRLYLPNELFDMLHCYFNEVDERYQFQTESDRQQELQKIRKSRIQNILNWLLSTAVFLTPVWLKEKIKKTIRNETEEIKRRQFIISNDQNYPAEAVTADSQRYGAYPRNLFAVCKHPKMQKE